MVNNSVEVMEMLTVNEHNWNRDMMIRARPNPDMDKAMMAKGLHIL